LIESVIAAANCVSIFTAKKKNKNFVCIIIIEWWWRLKNHRGDGSERELQARHFLLKMDAQSFFFIVFDADIRVNTHFSSVFERV